MSWPAQIKRQGELRSQYHPVIDVMPTLLEAAGVEVPEVVDGIAQTPVQGGSVSIAVDEQQVASGSITRRPTWMAGDGESFDTGRDTNVPVSPDYRGEGVFTGALQKVVVRLKMPR